MKKEVERVFTIKMTRALEDNAFATGITIFEMMEKAGKIIAEEIDKYAKKADKKNIVFLTGFGNNGGDGLVAARYLIEQDYNCNIILIGNKKKFNSLASQENYSKLKKVLSKENWFFVRRKDEFEAIFKPFVENSIIIDALLGIGIIGTLKEPYKHVIEYLNTNFKGDIISVDIPSGYDPEVDNELFLENPNKIICLGRNKIQEGSFSDASVVIGDIGIPEDCERYVGIGDLKWYYPQRAKDSHKRQNGVVTVIAGSYDYIGAPILAGLGAFRTGADLIFILTPSDIRNIVASFKPDFITIPGNEKEITPSDIVEMFSHPRLKGSSFVIGPGMMETETTKATLLEFLKDKTNRQVVIDASALSSIDEEHLFLLQYHNAILTPHRGEFNRIFKIKLTGNVKEDCKNIEDTAERWKTTLLVKGQYDIISNGKITKINKTGHPGMTVGGTGDVLTGIVAALLSVIDDTFISACLGAYISGAAGERAANDFGDGLMASDIPNYIYPIIKEALSFKAKEI
ncbi:MAG: NAD(P)H-hydrate dehydratase [Candidatus Heimdallarchaeaceae archaeon]|jgi:NAD(P)H-hydrate epimerase